MSVSTLTRPPTRHTSTPAVTVTIRLPWDPDLPIPEDPGQLVSLIGFLVSRGVNVTTDANPAPGHPLTPRTPSEITGHVPQTRSGSLDQPPFRPTPGGELRIDPRRRTVQRGTRPVALTRIEFDLLRYLAQHRRKVFTRHQLLDAVWQTTHANTRTVDVHIRRLRAKLGQHHPLMITIRSVGYRLDDKTDLVIVKDE